MSPSAFKAEPRAVAARCTDDALVLQVADGRELTVPLEWFPRLRGASPAARQNCRLIGGGIGLHWPDLDEDLSVSGLVAGR